MAIRADGRQIALAGVADDAIEEVRLRGRNRMAFRRSGEAAVQFVYQGAPIHRRVGEAWNPYDLRWVGRNGYYVLRGSDQDIAVALSSGATPLIACRRGDDNLRLTPIMLTDLTETTRRETAAAPTQLLDDADDGHNRGGQAVFPGIFGDGTHLGIRATERGFRKALRIATADLLDDYTGTKLLFVWKLATTAAVFIDGVPWDGASAVGDRIEIRRDDESLWTFPRPVAWDSDGNEIEGVYRLSTKNAATLLAVQFGLAPLRRATFPIFIDPYTSNADDGGIYGLDAVYAIARATSIESPSANASVDIGQYLSGTYRCRRGYVRFDTSDIDDGYVVTNASLTLTCTSDYSTTDYNVIIQAQDWVSPLAADREANYDGCLVAAADATWRNTAGIATNTPYAANVSTARINKTGYTYYSMISDRDIAGTAPTGLEIISIGLSENATAAYRPTLTVTAIPRLLLMGGANKRGNRRRGFRVGMQQQ